MLETYKLLSVLKIICVFCTPNHPAEPNCRTSIRTRGPWHILKKQPEFSPHRAQELGLFFASRTSETTREHEYVCTDSYELAAVGDVLATPADVIWLWTLSKVLVV